VNADATQHKPKQFAQSARRASMVDTVACPRETQP
jgi:hypothetical protein